jgi:hypothetical protein
LFEVVSSGPNTRKLVIFNFITSLRKFPKGGTFSTSIVPGRSTFRA